ncbi:MAG: metallophosphoesterase family protein [bacterium]|nr:metallophosphoesterase family protein [bacterium]
MRYAILGDIHANLTALETVLASIQSEGVDRILSVGDVVGYGAAPTEVVQIVRELDVVVVKGNHDAACVDELDTTYFNPYARAAVDWTREALDDPDLEWLRALPLVQHLEECTVSHGTLSHPERFDYIQCTEDADPSLDELDVPVCFVGHTHVPVAIMRNIDDPTRTSYTTESEIDMSTIARAIVNVGSVGQPRDEIPFTGYALYDTEAERVWIKRLEYLVEREARRIRAAGLPGMLADRLFLGV